MSKTAEEMLADAIAGAKRPNVEADFDAKMRRIDASENRDIAPNAGKNELATLLPVSNSVARGYGAHGPQYFTILVDESDTFDMAGDPVPKLVDQTKRLTPWGIGDQLEATGFLAGIHDQAQQIALVWSLQAGEGVLDPVEAAKALDSIYPKFVPGPDGVKIQVRDDFQADRVQAQMTLPPADLTRKQVQAMEDLILLSFARCSPSVTVQYYRKNFKWADCLRCIGKILWVNSPFHKRFLD